MNRTVSVPSEAARLPRAEEMIAEVCRQIHEIRDSGGRASRIVMMPSQWEQIDDYRRSLGVISGTIPDYLTENSLFGLEIWYGDSTKIQVE